MRDSDCVALMQWACPRMGLRWQGFRNVRSQVCKRIGRRLSALGLQSVEDYRSLLERDAREWHELEALCRVTISRFYRDRAVFDALRLRHFPELLQRHGVVRCWSAGACSGEEPYTLAMVLEGVAAERYEILATDADELLLERARRGCYPSASLQELPDEWASEAFDAQGDDRCVRPRFRSRIRFVLQDLKRELPTGPFEAILCRNVVFTYFAPELQLPMLEKFVERLSAGGVIVLGGHEKLPDGHDRFVESTLDHAIFRKR